MQHPPYTVWRIDGKKKHLNGRFDTAEQAADAERTIKNFFGPDAKVLIEGPKEEVK